MAFTESFILIFVCISFNHAHLGTLADPYVPTLNLLQPQLGEIACHRYIKDPSLAVQVLGLGMNGTMFASLRKLNASTLVFLLNGSLLFSERACVLQLRPESMVELEEQSLDQKQSHAFFTIDTGNKFHLGIVISTRGHDGTTMYQHLFTALSNVGAAPKKPVHKYHRFFSKLPLPPILLSSTHPRLVYGLRADPKANETFCLVEVQYNTATLEQMEDDGAPTGQQRNIKYDLKSMNRCICSRFPLSTGFYSHHLDLLIAVSNAKQKVLLYRNISSFVADTVISASTELPFTKFFSCSLHSGIRWYIYPIAVNLVLLVELVLVLVIVKYVMGEDDDCDGDPWTTVKKCKAKRSATDQEKSLSLSGGHGMRSTSLLSVGF